MELKVKMWIGLNVSSEFFVALKAMALHSDIDWYKLSLFVLTSFITCLWTMEIHLLDKPVVSLSYYQYFSHTNKQTLQFYYYAIFRTTVRLLTFLFYQFLMGNSRYISLINK